MSILPCKMVLYTGSHNMYVDRNSQSIFTCNDTKQQKKNVHSIHVTHIVFVCTVPQEVDPTYSPVSLLPSKASYAFPVLTTLETYTPSAYSSVQELDFDSSVKCNAIQQVHCSNCYSLELLGTASETIHEGSEPSDNQSASSLEDKGSCFGTTSDVLKEKATSASIDQLQAKSLQSNNTTEDRHDNATHQQMNEHTMPLTSSAPAVHCPSSGYVPADGDDMLHSAPSSAQDQWKMTTLASENYQSTPYTFPTSELLPNSGHDDTNGKNQSLGYEPQPTAKHSPLSEPLCDSGIPTSMLGLHFRLPLPSYNTTDSSASFSGHISSGYSSSSDYMLASSVTSASDTSGPWPLYSTNEGTNDFPGRVCHITEMGEDTQTPTIESLHPALSSEDDSGIHTSLNISSFSDSNVNVKVCPKTGIPAPSTFTSLDKESQYCMGFNTNNVREQDVLPG